MIEQLNERTRAVLWAKERVASDFVALSIQTTGLVNPAPVQIALVSMPENEHWSALINPGKTIEHDATRIHGWSDEDVANAPRFGEVYPELNGLLSGASIVNYGARFHREVLEAACQRTSAPQIRAHWSDAMHVMARYIGNWSDYHQDYQNVSLVNACSHFRLPRPTGDAESKCRAIIAIVKALSEQEI